MVLKPSKQYLQLDNLSPALIATAVASTESSAEETTKATPKATGITLF
ncbi:hypothetical protein BFJ63_vAg4203 [Fusarium oxysporum f. sp. narcissi]|nr:hypothetical protein BFJ70_g6524 [Fusarium oxysporum]RYC93067.1 hypothetical protein BFJ63_vAg4203 [Fusarium oxysporum f. sp. narcissi]